MFTLKVRTQCLWEGRVVPDEREPEHSLPATWVQGTGRGGGTERGSQPGVDGTGMSRSLQKDWSSSGNLSVVDLPSFFAVRLKGKPQ